MSPNGFAGITKEKGNKIFLIPIPMYVAGKGGQLKLYNYKLNKLENKVLPVLKGVVHLSKRVTCDTNDCQAKEYFNHSFPDGAPLCALSKTTPLTWKAKG